MTTQTTIATEAGHWYTPDGQPMYTITGSNGNERPTTLRDARKHGLVPGVTTITNMMPSFGLQRWGKTNILHAGLTLPPLPVECGEKCKACGRAPLVKVDDFAERVIADAEAQSEAAKARGSELHGDLEKAMRGEEHGHLRHVAAVVGELTLHSIHILQAEAEKSFASPAGYGGKVDAHSIRDNWVVDFKTKEKITGDQLTGRGLVYDEHAQQLSAYRFGLGMPTARCYNVFVGVQDCRVVVVEHQPEALQRGWTMFLLCLKLWQLKNNYMVTP